MNIFAGVVVLIMIEVYEKMVWRKYADYLLGRITQKQMLED